MFQLRTIAKRVEGIEALDRPAEQVGKLLEPYLTKRPLKDILSGTWIGHPLHPVLTDVVIGSWVSAGFLDLFPTKASSRAADKLILLGCASALPTAVAGASDWIGCGLSTLDFCVPLPCGVDCFALGHPGREEWQTR